MLHDVEDTFLTLQDAFTTAIQFFAKRIVPHGAPLTEQQAVDILDVYDTLLGVETDGHDRLQQQRELQEREQQQRAHVARLSLEGHFAALLVNILSQHLSHVHPQDAQRQEPFLALRMRSLLSLQRLLIACSESGNVISMLCFRIVIQDSLLQQLLRVLAESPYEPLRAGVGETLFIFLVRIHDAPTGFVGCGGVEAMCRAVVADRSPAVRTVCAGVLRELAETHVDGLAGPAAVEALRRALRDDGAAEVRVLAAEVLERVVHRRAGEALRDPRALLDAARRALLPGEEGSGGVGVGVGRGGPPEAPAVAVETRTDPVAPVEAAARLLETATAAAAAHRLQEYFAHVTTEGMVEALLQRLGSQSHSHYQHNNGNAALARTLRMLLQYTPPTFALPCRILQNRELLAILLKTIVDAGRGRTIPGEDYAAFQIKNVELALCFAIIASQSSSYREYLSKELCDYPQWGTAIKKSVLSLLSAASLDYFTSIELYDITGFHLNKLNGVNWDVDNTPQNEYVVKLFQDQVRREGAKQKSVRSEYHTSLFPEVEIGFVKDQEKKVRLTFLILFHATNITFTVDNNMTAEMKPNFSELHTGKRNTLRFRLSSPAALSSKHYNMQQQQQQQFVGKRENILSPDSCFHSNLPLKDQSTVINDEMGAMAIAYDKFNSSMSFVLKYTQHYSTKKQKVEDVVETKDGYVVHLSRLKNPWHPIVENQKLKTWQVNDLKVGDLFYFSLPFDDIGTDTLNAVVYKARKHMAYIKRELLTAPQSNKGRRWFLHDMMKNIMPNMMTLLEELKTIVQNYGGDSTRFPIFLFREKELHFGERSLHPGNIVEVIDQIQFYFSQNVEETIGVNSERLLQLSQQLDNIEKSVNINAVFDAYSPSVILCGAGENEDDGDDGYGHGTISSDSEIGN
ncbi:putative casein kinase II, alpha chain [Trypanosoma theileri]|uniref:Putative casein kinase II, alpha chain n=1 Tax=Trypanosoma theileri TaxID=67003 RepID=A0A1X0NVM2_9TRYP|nr:putative casein kinase II, alpha chain [Trypanosoma theileri]ORC88661.1 putative casein kinase II, alpha chain [Trypanosoma theileri]